MKDGFVKVGSVSPKMRVADVRGNTESCIKEAMAAAEAGVKVLCFPELALTGYTCGDLFGQALLLREAEAALERYMDATCGLDMISFIGVPVALFDRLYNCGAAVFKGRLLGLVPKTYIPSRAGSFEARYFAAGTHENTRVKFAGQDTVFGSKLIFANAAQPSLRIACEIGEDVQAIVPPSCAHAAAGANLIVCPSASKETADSQEGRRALVCAHSARILSAYVCANASDGESTTDTVFAAHDIIAECGKIKAEAKPFSDCGMTASEIDVLKITAERRISGAFGADAIHGYELVSFSLEETETELTAIPSASPFMTGDCEKDRERCDHMLEIQARGLAGRLERSYSKSMVIGVSGGLDSTLALLAAARAADIIGMDRKSIIGVTMPCFGTTKRTRSNAEKLANALGITFRTVDIKKSVTQHLKDIGHDGITADVTYENAQARERTQVLMDIANSSGGLVVGTGDLSELILGFATYNGDHMSMYGVNSSIPKTLIRRMVSVYAEHERERGNRGLASVLEDILATPVSPELLPPKDGAIAQCTESLVGPYELHDYFIYYTLKYGFEPRKIYRLAKMSFAGVYESSVILGWLRVFVRRFISQQFKRSCLPDGPQVCELSVSPRGGLVMPSDACLTAWMAELDAMEKEENGDK